MLVHRRVTPPPPRIKFAGTFIHLGGEKHSESKVYCPRIEHSTFYPTRARTGTARSGVERTNHEATAPPTIPQEKQQNKAKNLKT